MNIILNGEIAEIPKHLTDDMLLNVLREYFGLVGAKFGCGAGACGACTVVVDGDAIRSCVMPMSALEGAEIRTIEGVSKGDTLHPVQEAWLKHAVPQCGYCQAGQIMSAISLLEKTPAPSSEQIDAAMEGNLCRCGTYARIRAAIGSVAASA